jgi:SSS family solute:Na+ symporter
MVWVITIGGLLYNVIIIGLVTMMIERRKRMLGDVKDDFVTSGRNLPWYVVSATIALTTLGGGHINGLPAQAWGTGEATIYYCIAHGIVYIILLRFLAPWFLRMNYVTIPSMLGSMYGTGFSALALGCFVAAAWSSVSLETQGLSVVISGMTPLGPTSGAVVGSVIGLLYVLFAGMKEVGWVNLFNAILMYIVGIFMLVFVGIYVTKGGGHGWETITDYFRNDPEQEELIRAFGSGRILKTYVIGTMVSVGLGMNMNQGNMQSAVSVRNISVLKKALYGAIPLNVCFGILIIGLGLASKAVLNIVPEAASAYEAGNFGVVWLAMNAVPWWVSIGWIGVALAALLSSWAMISLGGATVIVRDLQIPFFTKGRCMDNKTETKWVRIWIFIIGATATVIALGVPNVIPAITWRVSFEIPLFVMLVYGLVWKRSPISAIVTVIVCWAMNCVVTLFNLTAALHMEGDNYSIIMTVIAFILGAVITVCDKKAKPGYVKLYKEQKAAARSQRPA